MAPTEPEIDIYPCGPGDQEAVVNCSLSAFYYKYEDSNSEGRTASIFRNQFSKAMGDPNHTCFKAVDLDTKKNLLGVIHVVYRQPKEKSEENPTVRGVIVDNNLFKRGKTDPYFCKCPKKQTNATRLMPTQILRRWLCTAIKN